MFFLSSSWRERLYVTTRKIKYPPTIQIGSEIAKMFKKMRKKLNLSYQQAIKAHNRYVLYVHERRVYYSND